MSSRRPVRWPGEATIIGVRAACSRLWTGSKSSISGSTPSALPRTGSTSASSPILTDQDLEKLGVLLDHRRKLLRAIAEMDGVDRGASKRAVEPPVVPRSQGTAERRQVTVMFSDLVGSTALSARMDPEDLREVISAYQKCVAETVRHFGGFVAKYMGDGVLLILWVSGSSRGRRRESRTGGACSDRGGGRT
jgi:Adenylate and Guanylate cyclase catalytic domain